MNIACKIYEIDLKRTSGQIKSLKLDCKHVQVWVVSQSTILLPICYTHCTGFVQMTFQSHIDLFYEKLNDIKDYAEK